MPIHSDARVFVAQPADSNGKETESKNGHSKSAQPSGALDKNSDPS
jgi:hypothetical protein